METVLLAALLLLAFGWTAGSCWIIWTQWKKLDEAFDRYERMEARHVEAFQELSTKVKATTLEEATRYNALMAETRRPRPHREPEPEAYPYMTPEMAERLSGHPDFQKMLMEQDVEG